MASAKKSTSELWGVILAAGKGTRIQPFSEHLPKPLLPILDRPLLEWQIEAMRGLGIRRIVIVIGHLGHHVVQSLGDGSALGVELTYVEQEEVLGIAHAVAQLEAHVPNPFLLFLGDIFFETDNLSQMLELFERPDVDGVLAVKPESDVKAIQRNFTVQRNEFGFVTRVIEKPRHPRTNLKGCGLYLFDATIFDSIRRTPRTAMRNEYELTDSIQIFIDDGYGVVPAPVVIRDLNLSNPADLLEINLHVMQRDGHTGGYQAADAVIEEGAEVVDSVLMKGSRVPAGSRLKRCMVMPGDVASPGEHHSTIFLRGTEINCHQ